jgi:hypothetical protein
MKTGDRVKITGINDEERAAHLNVFIGHEGNIGGWVICQQKTRYKVRFDDGNSAYFRDGEMEVIN